MELTSTHLRYLLTMYELSKTGNDIRLTEIASILQVKKAPAARIVAVFRNKELVIQQPYGKVHLTEYGRQTAGLYEQCVDNLAACLIRAGLPLSAQEAQQAACVLLTELPEACIRKMKKVVDN